MIVVTVQLVSAITGKTTTLGQALISNDGTGTQASGNYRAAFGRKGQEGHHIFVKPARRSVVTGFPRLRLNVWHLLKLALDNAGYGR
jgi:hypothetical protein